MRYFAVATGFVLFLAFAAPSQAADACYTWVCNDTTHVCTFDASCSTWTGPLWRFRWNFGDGSGLAFTGNPTIQHTFSIPYPTVELMVIPLSTSSDTAACQIRVWNQVGPALGTSGTCN